MHKCITRCDKIHMEKFIVVSEFKSNGQNLEKQRGSTNRFTLSVRMLNVYATFAADVLISATGRMHTIDIAKTDK